MTKSVIRLEDMRFKDDGSKGAHGPNSDKGSIKRARKGGDPMAQKGPMPKEGPWPKEGAWLNGPGP